MDVQNESGNGTATRDQETQKETGKKRDKMKQGPWAVQYGTVRYGKQSGTMSSVNALQVLQQ